MGIARIFTEEETTELVDRFIEGEGLDSLREYYKTSLPVLKRILAERGVSKNDRLRSPKSRPHRGANNHQWKGGRRYDHSGYVLIWIDPEGSDVQYLSEYRQYVQEHRLVVAKLLGRPLLSTEHIHHKNGKKDDNRPSNLELRNKPHGHGIILRCRSCHSSNIIGESLHEEK